MPARQTLPTDDLYARLGVPRDASPEAIDLAWRGLLRRHHPDVAGPEALELAKRINVAHDWLSDPALRHRYDRERWPGIRGGRPPRAASGWAGDVGVSPRAVRRPPTTAELADAVVDRVERLSADELDRLSLAEPAPIAFLATLRQFVPPALELVLATAERRAIANLPAAARRRPAIRDAVVGRLADIVLGDLIDDILGDLAGARARERLTRGWDAAVGQPRYGPATTAVTTLLERLRGLDQPPHPRRQRCRRPPRRGAVATIDLARRGRGPACLVGARRGGRRSGDPRQPGSRCPIVGRRASRRRPDRPPSGPAPCVPRIVVRPPRSTVARRPDRAGRTLGEPPPAALTGPR